MDRIYFIKRIVDDMERYMRILGMAENMVHQTGDIEWIMPLPGQCGPSLVYKITLPKASAISQVDALITGIKNNSVPSLWFISPTSTPENIVDILAERGFKDLSNPEEPEFGMALEMNTPPYNPITSRFHIKKVQLSAEFTTWIEIVNVALHGSDLLNATYSYPMVARNDMTFFLAYLNQTPIATLATIHAGDRASIEFVSTLKQYRCLGAATAICQEALQFLFTKGIRVVTLRSSYEAVHLYEKLGFKKYFATSAMAYQPG